MKKKEPYLVFLKIAIPFCLIVIICCYILKVNLDIIGNICAIFMILLFGTFIINFFIIEPQKDFKQTKINLEKNGDNDERIESFVKDILNDSNLKKCYTVRKVLSPFIVIPFSIVFGIVIRIIIEKQFSNIYSYYQIQNIEKYVIIMLVAICIYSIYTWFRKAYQIIQYTERECFNYIASCYQMTEMSGEDTIVSNTVKEYLMMTKGEKSSDFTFVRNEIKERLKGTRKEYYFKTDKIYKHNLSEKRLFELNIYRQNNLFFRSRIQRTNLICF